ncbi:hypothetical protein N3K66_000368 [Trichothecium roseum]|uniref:Uncharacterized protein n=1 Tax=Trichothecium roseum TaxID=47278 RepID=A0ACC0VCB7_9HYPO|nr:hypothetical protein N3K66_000368 [Trichothecium roseum]
MPATKRDMNMCKTLMTMTILGYPTPRIVAWGDGDDSEGLVGGGSHYSKITKTLEFLDDEQRRNNRPEFEDELVFMIDSYDIWFQLPVHTLIDRYHAIVKEENERVRHRMGHKAYDREGINSQIVFGAGKRCAPNQMQSIACYPVPDSPLPRDIHGGATDTVLGRTRWTSHRTRYLNSGYIIGPVRQVRAMLQRAQLKLGECAGRERADFDDGSGSTGFCYRGSDQSIFVEMFGEQEFQREIMRRHHRGAYEDYLDGIIPNRAGARPATTFIENVPVDDLLEPGFPHQENDTSYDPGKPHEYGIALDYWSALGHQTMHAERDFRYIRHDRPVEEQFHGEGGMFDCKNMKAPFPADLPRGTSLNLLRGEMEGGGETEEGKDVGWDALPLFHEVCVGTAPVMLHHNSVDKRQREAQWDRTWWHGHSRNLLAKRRELGAPQLVEGIPVEGGDTLTWEELCPSEYDAELFRDVPFPTTTTSTAATTTTTETSDTDMATSPEAAATTSEAPPTDGSITKELHKSDEEALNALEEIEIAIEP